MCLVNFIIITIIIDGYYVKSCLCTCSVVYKSHRHEAACIELKNHVCLPDKTRQDKTPTCLVNFVIITIYGHQDTYMFGELCYYYNLWTLICIFSSTFTIKPA